MQRTGPIRVQTFGSSIDRGRSVTFTFNGKPYSGLAGDSLASALLANGIRTISRSFKFHRPRGIFSCGIEEPNGLLQLGEGAQTTVSVRTPLVPLAKGMRARSQAGWPSVSFDVLRALDFIAPLFAAGFYSKTFIWPNWHTYEPLIRNLAGLGRAPEGPDPDRYDVQNAHCDVLVIGGGVPGLRAALDAANGGDRVILVDQDIKMGGTARWDGSAIDGVPAATWLTRTIEHLYQLPDVHLLPRTTAVGYHDHNVVTLVERVDSRHSGLPRIQSNNGAQRSLPRERYWIVRAKRVVVGTGAIEQPLVFCNNDRPGIMLAGAAHQYLRRYGVAIGSRVLIATNNDSVYTLAKDLSTAGVTVVGVVDTRQDFSKTLRAQMRSLSIETFIGSIPIDTAGFSALKSVTLGSLSQDGSAVESRRTIRCDALAVSGGFTPNLHLYSQAGGRLTYDDCSGALIPMTSGAFWPATKHPSIDVAGRACHPRAGGDLGPRISAVGNSGRKWVDLLHDVTVADLELALRENYSSIEHVKRYTTVGMAVDQGKTSTVTALEIVARLKGMNPSELGHTTMRPPFTPVTLGAIAGRSVGERFAPSRRSPLHDAHLAHGAILEDYGEWKRPAYYRRALESGDPVKEPCEALNRGVAIRREALAVRTCAGLFDGSPLGKIEVQGQDALEFLDRFYINNLKTLKPGRVRYGLMLRETGTIFDDGTVVMLAPDRFLITTTSGNAARVTAWLEEWHQCEWPQLRVAITQVTEQWAVLSLAGPRARDILSRLDTNIDLSNEVFPHLTMREGQLLGKPTRIYRVSFSGELTYEMNVPASAARDTWRTILATGAPEGLEPFGLEALLLMRLEKGYLHIGTDTDGTTVPDDVGFGKVAPSKQADFIGKRSLLLPDNVRPDRLQLVGLTSYTDLTVGSHLRLKNSSDATDGWITSAGRSVLTGEPIAMAMLRGGRQRIGEQLAVHDANTIAGAKVVNLPHFDPTGDRMQS